MGFSVMLEVPNSGSQDRSQLFTGVGEGGGLISLVHHLRSEGDVPPPPPPTRGNFCNFYTKMEQSGAYLR